MREQIAKSIGVIGGTALVAAAINANFWGIMLVVIGTLTQLIVYFAVPPTPKGR